MKRIVNNGTNYSTKKKNIYYMINCIGVACTSAISVDLQIMKPITKA